MVSGWKEPNSSPCRERRWAKGSSRAVKLFAGAAPDLGNIFERDSGFEEDCAGDLMLSWMCWRSSRS